ncbi:MAG: MarR family transcriptional regulator [Oscillibacter sp.]|nr:MarR family transcriptional regulator [Oscillibacter sp.]
MTAQERKKYEAYIRRYYDIYFRMDALYNLWSSANRIQDTTLFVLNEISAQECCTQRSLASRLGYSKQTISSALRRLEQGGIISRQRDPMDQRNNLVRLTSRGRTYAEGLISRLRDAEVRAFQSWSDQETEQILQAFDQLTGALADSILSDLQPPPKDP